MAQVGGCGTRDGGSVRSRRLAFTFIEILVVVVIIGIASAVVMPQLTSRNDLRATAAARQLVADLIFAQSRAIAQQKNVYVVFDPGLQAYQLFVGPSMTPIMHPVNRTNFIVQFGSSGLSGVTLQSAQIGAGQVVAFDSTGVPHQADLNGVLQDMTSDATVIIASGGKTRTVKIGAFTGESQISG